MKKIILVLCFCLFITICADAVRQVTWDDSKLIRITINPEYTATGVTFQISTVIEIYDENDEFVERRRLVAMRSELDAPTRANLDNFVMFMNKSIRNAMINENNDNLPPIE